MGTPSSLCSAEFQVPSQQTIRCRTLPPRPCEGANWHAIDIAECDHPADRQAMASLIQCHAQQPPGSDKTDSVTNWLGRISEGVGGAPNGRATLALAYVVAGEGAAVVEVPAGAVDDPRSHHRRAEVSR